MFSRVDTAISEWLKERIGIDVPIGSLLLVKRALQGLPEIMDQWVIRANMILGSLVFAPSKIDMSMYRRIRNGREILVAMQVYDFLWVSKMKKDILEVVREIYINYKAEMGQF